MIDLDALVSTAVAEAQIENGMPAKLLAAASNKTGYWKQGLIAAGRAQQGTASTTMTRWTPKDDAFLRDNLGALTIEEIASYLGRSTDAIKIRWTRKGYTAPSKQPGTLTAQEVARRMGVCGKSIRKLIDLGLMPSDRSYTPRRSIRVINETTLLQWAVQPRNWIYFRFNRIRDPHIRRLVELRRERWQDAWWSTGRVARYHNVSISLVNKYVRDGRLPATRWYNWHVLRSDAIRTEFRTREDSFTRVNHGPAGDAFIILARAIGLSWTLIDLLRASETRYAVSRVRTMQQRDEIESIIAQFNLQVDYNPSTGRLWCDWRLYRQRFPGVDAAVRRFLQGTSKSNDLETIRGILYSWAAWHADSDERRDYLSSLRFSGGKADLLMEKYEHLKTWGIDPLGGDQIFF